MRLFSTPSLRPRAPHLIVAALVLFPTALGCGEDSQELLSCTAVGCGHGLTIEVRTADDTWPPGEYSIELTFDGKTAQCSYTWTGMTQANGFANVAVTCDPDVSAMFNARTTTSKKVADDGTTTLTYTPIPGQFHLLIWFQGTPAAVHVAVRHDGTLIGQHDFSPGYSPYYPNGPECDDQPCVGAVASWQMP